MDSECVTNLMDVARQKQKRICECFIKNIDDILAYVRKRNTTQRETFKTFYTLTRFQGHMYAHREVSHALFLKLKQFWKICPANTLHNTIFSLPQYIFKGIWKLWFSDNLRKYLLLCIMSGCVPALTIFTLKTMQVKSFG